MSTSRSVDAPLSVGEALERGERRLRGAGIEPVDTEVRLLLGHVLCTPHLAVGLERDRQLTPSETRLFLALLDERARRRPLQHLLGDVDFYGRRFIVMAGVLIPRPETESVAAVALGEIPGDRPWHVAEVGCGAGVLAVTIACERPRTEVWCTDIDARAVDLTIQNATVHAVNDRVHARGGDLLAPIAEAAPFQLVISNPPYIPRGEIEKLAPEVRDHDPRPALDGGADGLDLVRRLLSSAPASLAQAGTIILELGYDQGEAAAQIARDRGWQEVRILPDLAGRDRVLQATRPRVRE